MKAKTAQIYLDGKLILQAAGLQYDGKKLQLTGMLLQGTVDAVKLPTNDQDIFRADKKSMLLEIRLSLL